VGSSLLVSKWFDLDVETFAGNRSAISTHYVRNGRQCYHLVVFFIIDFVIRNPPHFWFFNPCTLSLIICLEKIR
jgi:hypothetical protein